MPKQKTHRGAAKRLALTKNGLVKRAKAFKRHILNKKTRKTKRNLRRTAYVSQSYAGTMKKLIPYKYAQPARRFYHGKNQRGCQRP